MYAKLCRTNYAANKGDVYYANDNGRMGFLYRCVKNK